jgi:hypothetical protein
MIHKENTYTIALPRMIVNEIAKYAERNKISKNKVIEIAVKRFMEAEIKNELINSFKQVANDPEIKEMAEWGLGDYLEQLKDLEK